MFFLGMEGFLYHVFTLFDSYILLRFAIIFISLWSEFGKFI